MKRIVIVGLMMLLGDYGAVRAQDKTSTDQEKAARDNAAVDAAVKKVVDTEKADAATEFLGMKFGLGVGVFGGFGGSKAVEKASIVGTNKIVRIDEEGDLRPQVFLEAHSFLWGGGKVKNWPGYRKTWKESTAPLDEDKLPTWGYGPFIALQSSGKTVVDALAIGLMWGKRMDVKSPRSINIGVGLSFTSGVQVLGDGIKEGQSLPAGEDTIRFKKEGRFGWALMTSFAF